MNRKPAKGDRWKAERAARPSYACEHGQHVCCCKKNCTCRCHRFSLVSQKDL